MMQMAGKYRPLESYRGSRMDVDSAAGWTCWSWRTGQDSGRNMDSLDLFVVYVYARVSRSSPLKKPCPGGR
jgi:hypothetical protein